MTRTSAKRCCFVTSKIGWRASRYEEFGTGRSPSQQIWHPLWGNPSHHTTKPQANKQHAHNATGSQKVLANGSAGVRLVQLRDRSLGSACQPDLRSTRRAVRLDRGVRLRCGIGACGRVDPAGGTASIGHNRFALLKRLLRRDDDLRHLHHLFVFLAGEQLQALEGVWFIQSGPFHQNALSSLDHFSVF